MVPLLYREFKPQQLFPNSQIQRGRKEGGKEGGKEKHDEKKKDTRIHFSGTGSLSKWVWCFLIIF